MLLLLKPEGKVLPYSDAYEVTGYTDIKYSKNKLRHVVCFTPQNETLEEVTRHPESAGLPLVWGQRSWGGCAEPSAGLAWAQARSQAHSHHRGSPRLQLHGWRLPPTQSEGRFPAAGSALLNEPSHHVSLASSPGARGPGRPGQGSPSWARPGLAELL